MSTEEESVEFKAIEAALAELAPTAGGLDRDRLMYLAGRASVLANGEVRTFRWAWPVATAAMTTVAAALLAVVSLRLADPAPRTVEVPVERIVEVTVERSPAAAVVDKAASAADDQQFSPERESSNGNDRPAAVSDPWSIVSRLVRWPAVDGRGPISHDGYTALRNQLLRDGASAWTEPPSRQAPADGATQPASYRQMLDSLLDDAGGSKSATGRPAGRTLIFPGGHS
jgi:hypothetical protein